jgi:hypothetical protein
MEGRKSEIKGKELPVLSVPVPETEAPGGRTTDGFKAVEVFLVTKQPGRSFSPPLASFTPCAFSHWQSLYRHCIRPS